MRLRSSFSSLLNGVSADFLMVRSLSFFKGERLVPDAKLLLSAGFNGTIYLAESACIGSFPGSKGSCANIVADKRLKEITSNAHLSTAFFIDFAFFDTSDTKIEKMSNNKM